MTEAATAFQNVSTIVDCIIVCRDGYRKISKFIRTLKEMGKDVAELEQRFREEECRLWTFALARNLVVDDDHPIYAAPTSLPQLWVEVVDTRFALIREHLAEAEQLVCKYDDKLSAAVTKPSRGTASEPTSHMEKQLDEFKEVPSYNLKRRPTESPSVLSAEIALNSRSQALQSLNFRLKFHWSIKDKKILEMAIDKLEADNNSLWRLIEPNQMNMMIDAVASKMSVADWDNFRARSTSKPNEAQHDPGKQEYDQRIQQQAQARTYISSLDKETISQKLTRSLDISCFPEIWSGSLPEKRTRTLTTYSANGSDVEVLIEWKEWTPSLITRDEVVTRVSDIVAILSSPPSCINNILSSLGFFEDNRGNDRGMKWVGIVYDTASLGHRPRIRTMRDLLTRPAGKSREIWKPPLGDRFRLAHHLAETLLAVHNCDWLHKGLRPENIVFFSTERSINNPYLLGWDSSRSSRRGQKTEPVMSWHPDLELYQHPLWFEDPSPEDSDQSRFRIEFDHYQLGCVLLEIGLWCLIGDLKKAKGDTFSGPNWREEWKKYLEHKTKILEVEMGKIYSEVVLNLLQGLDAYGKDMEYWNVVVRQLSICTA